LQKAKDGIFYFFKRFLADAEWETVEKQTEVVDPYKTSDEEVCIVNIT
jgi:hypothetical protein